MSDREHGAEDRLRDALHAQSQADDISTDAWAKIRGGVNARAARRRTTVWTSLGLAGAAAAVIAVIGFASLSGDGDKQVVDNPDDTATGFVALNNDGEIVHYDATGRNLGVILETDWVPGANYTAPQIAVGSDETVYVSRLAPADTCEAGNADGITPRTAEIVAVPLGGGEPEVVADIGFAPAVSPDGSTLAYLTTPSGDRCADVDNPERTTADGLSTSEPTVVALLDLETGERTIPSVFYPDEEISVYEPTGPLSWSPDGVELAMNARCVTPGGECENAFTALVPSEGGGAKFVYSWGEGRGGPAVAFLDDRQLLVDSSVGVGDKTSVGIADVGVSEPVGGDSLALPQFLVLPDQTEILQISTLPGDNAPGVLVTTSNYGDGTSAATVYHGQEGMQVLVENVAAAAWIPGTTFDDLETVIPVP